MAAQTLLTQEEIDALLELVEEKGAGDPRDSGGEPEAPEGADDTVRKRDFSRPDPLPKSEQQWFQGEATHAAVRLAESLTKWLGYSVRVECVGIELQPYESILRSLETPCLVYRYGGPDGEGVLALDPSLALATVDRLLGGQGKARYVARTLTAVELPIAAMLAERVLTALADGLADVVTLPRQPAGPPAMHVRQARVLRADEKCLVLTYAVAGDLAETELRLVLSAASLAKKRADSDAPKDEGLPPELSKVGVELGVKLSEADLTLAEILALEPGDVVTLDGDAGSPVCVEVEGRPVARGTLGAVHENFAVSIDEILPTTPRRAHP